jgi:sensor histidine kinase regulating citrate/malate metabolism
MIATKNNSIQVESNVQGEKIAMGIDPAAMAHIMSILTDLYSDPEYAVIREYSTNAFDSHIEAGQTRPIEVTLPTDLAPFLTIRDFGIGLDAEGIESIYSLYGASTKRNTNDQVGMLGLGCKSALTYKITIDGLR